MYKQPIYLLTLLCNDFLIPLTQPRSTTRVHLLARKLSSTLQWGRTVLFTTSSTNSETTFLHFLKDELPKIKESLYTPLRSLTVLHTLHPIQIPLSSFVRSFLCFSFKDGFILKVVQMTDNTES